MENDLTEGSPNTLSLAFVEGLYADYLRDPSLVAEDWQAYFAELTPDANFTSAPQLGPSFLTPSLFNPAPATSNGHGRSALNGNGKSNGHGNGHAAPGWGNGVSEAAVRQDRVDALIRAYRVRGHMIAKIDPLGLPRPLQAELDPEFHGLTGDDLDRKFSSRTIFGAESLTLREMLKRLRNTYCRSIGVQFMHIDDLKVKNWLQDRMEGSENRVELLRSEQLRIFTKLTDATTFEDFLRRKFSTVKTFSLAGSESLIPLLALAIDRAGEHGVDEIILGMAHRGRLNVLANIMGKSPREIFREVEDSDPELYFGSGDVKYHLGHSSDFVTESGKKVHLSLCFNPSHLEFVNPVVLGRARAKQDRVGDTSH
ncbi:MAG TPA: 2-oxoglutarate dehydrogenase E1 component, partial [Polyangiaceae bacterium]|nr:2-oxoglutarate dehydrogenase E1 component [Polyangiaceae bacterium]